jgi:hypothetical protein
LERALALLQADDADEEALDASIFAGEQAKAVAASPAKPKKAFIVPTLMELCVQNIGTNLHMYECMQGLPEYISELVLDKLKVRGIQNIRNSKFT